MADITSKVKDNISIEEMYELTEGKVEYGKANSIVKNMFYLSKSRQNAIALSNALGEILGSNSGFEDIVQHIREKQNQSMSGTTLAVISGSVPTEKVPLCTLPIRFRKTACIYWTSRKTVCHRKSSWSWLSFLKIPCGSLDVSL